jgi:hypothetical protein
MNLEENLGGIKMRKERLTKEQQIALIRKYAPNIKLFRKLSRIWDDKFEEKDLEKTIIKMYTISNFRRYDEWYSYREAVRIAELEDGKTLILYVDGYHYSTYVDSKEEEMERASNYLNTIRWQELKKRGVGKKLKEIVDLEEIKKQLEKRKN